MSFLLVPTADFFAVQNDLCAEGCFYIHVLPALIENPIQFKRDLGHHINYVVSQKKKKHTPVCCGNLKQPIHTLKIDFSVYGNILC